ncbi:hypothetical protein DXG03_002981, partial [Asterophora parasitica]
MSTPPSHHPPQQSRCAPARRILDSEEADTPQSTPRAPSCNSLFLPTQEHDVASQRSPEPLFLPAWSSSPNAPASEVDTEHQGVAGIEADDSNESVWSLGSMDDMPQHIPVVPQPIVEDPILQANREIAQLQAQLKMHEKWVEDMRIRTDRWCELVIELQRLSKASSPFQQPAVSSNAASIVDRDEANEPDPSGDEVNVVTTTIAHPMFPVHVNAAETAWAPARKTWVKVPPHPNANIQRFMLPMDKPTLAVDDNRPDDEIARLKADVEMLRAKVGMLMDDMAYWREQALMESVASR